VAERDRAQIAWHTLDQTIQAAHADWWEMFKAFSNSSLPGAFGSALPQLLKNPDVPLSVLAELATPENVCKDCQQPIVPESFFSIDPQSGESTTLGAAMSEALLSEIATATEPAGSVSLHDRIRGAVHFLNDGGEPRTAFVYVVLNTDGDVRRIVGLTLPNSTTQEMLRAALRQTRFLPSALVGGVPDDSLFTFAAHAGDATIMSSGTAEGIVHERGFSDPAIHGLTLSVGTRSGASERLLVDARGDSRVLDIVLLMTLIGGLLIVALIEVRREAQLSRLRADFVSGVTHELRTPLAQIRMFTETLLLGRTRSDLERRRSLEVIEQEARRLSHLVENVLLFSKSEGGRRPRVAPEPTPFAEEIRRAVESLSLLCRNRSAEVRLELQEDITVPVDRMALRQILINLVDNALKYGPAGQRITVGAALFDDVARVWVDDEGPGIPPEERVRVFDSFYRLPREADSRVAGSGIGLAVVRELARLHGGNAWAEAAPGNGARIVVQFPDAYLRTRESGNLAVAS